MLVVIIHRHCKAIRSVVKPLPPVFTCANTDRRVIREEKHEDA